jgi:hypothetical protein
MIISIAGTHQDQFLVKLLYPSFYAGLKSLI